MAYLMDATIVNGVGLKKSKRNGEHLKLYAAVKLKLFPNIIVAPTNVVRNTTTSVELCAMNVLHPGSLFNRLISYASAQLGLLDKFSGAKTNVIRQLLG